MIVGSDQVKVAQVACGLQHTVLLCDDGSVYTFGSNHYGQLGLEVRDKQCVKISCCSFHVFFKYKSKLYFLCMYSEPISFVGMPIDPASVSHVIYECMRVRNVTGVFML